MPAVVKTMSLDELKTALTPAELMERFTFDPSTGHGAFQEVDGKIKWQFGDRQFGVNADAYRRLGALLGIPKAYLEKTPHELMLPHVNYWLLNRQLPQIQFAVADNIVKLFSRQAVNPVSNMDILDIIQEQAGGGKIEAHHVSNSMFSTSFSITTENAISLPSTSADSPAVGDIVNTGVTIENSYAGTSPLTISTYVHRLVCTNGMVSAANVFRYSRRPDEATNDWLAEAISQALTVANQEVAGIAALREIKFDGHLSDSLGSVFEEFSVPSVARRAVQDMVVDRGVDNLLDLFHVVTDVASNNEDVQNDPRLARRMMRIGGQMVSHPDFCTTCHRVLAN